MDVNKSIEIPSNIQVELSNLRRKIEIENALNNVRSVFTDLHENTDLEQGVSDFFKEMQNIGLHFNEAFLFHFDNDTLSGQHEIFLVLNKETDFLIKEIHLSDFDHFSLNHLNQCREIKQTFCQFSLEVGEQQLFMEDLFRLADSMITDQAAIVQSEGLSVAATLANNSGIMLIRHSLKFLSEEETDLFKRFGAIIEQAFVRFMDLQRAKEQTRKAQIEVALERVRNRSMLMKHTSELQDIVNIVAQQLINLEININGGAFITINEEVVDHVPIWGCGGATSFAQKAVVYFLDRPIFTNLQQSIIERKPFMTESYSRSEKIEFFEHLYKHSPWKEAPQEFKDKLLNLEGGYSRSAVISNNTCIFIINNTGQPFSAQSNEILRRFGVVFEQAYTRFLDLQKAEEQAREAQIETALERVRSTSLAMHESKDLYKVVSATYIQMMHLRLPVDVCVIIDDLDHPTYLNFWATNAELSIPEKIKIPFADQPVLNQIHRAGRERTDFEEINLNKAEKDNYYQYIFSNSSPRNLISQERKEKIYAATGLNILISFMPHSALSINNYQGYVYNESEKQLIKRMHHVFEQAYIRFLDLQKSEEQDKRLKELEISKARFYTNITHEFRTPLTVITGMADQIMVDPDKWLHSGISMINRNAARLLELVNQMLELNKLESGTVGLSLQQSNIVKYLKYLTQSVISLADHKEINLHFDAESEEIFMDFDKEKIQILFTNLLSNAVKFTPQDGNIYVSVHHTGDLNSKNQLLQIKVRDTGVGISAENLPYIFDRFYQIDDSNTRTFEGSGIGLSLVQELVHLMKGTIEVKSEPNKGTEFMITLPINNGAAMVDFSDLNEKDYATESIFSSSDESLEGFDLEGPYPKNDRPRLLLIEDNQDVVVYVTSCLSQEYEIQVGKDGNEGIGIAIEEIPDIIISDVMMPIKDGFEVCQTLKKDPRTSHIPIIMLTAKADIESKLEGLERGADAYLQKPFHKQELQIRIKKLLELRTNLQKHYLTIAAAQSSAELINPSVGEVLSEEDHFFENLREMIVGNLKNYEFSVDQLCRVTTMSHSQLHRKISAMTGLSPIRFIRHVRLSRAQILLEKTDYDVKTIAYETGFTDPGYFSRIFKQELGVTPLQWKEQVVGARN